MLVIVRNRTKKRMVLGLRILVTLFIISLVVAHLYNIYLGNSLIREGWLRDDKPSGNPIRVENTAQPGQESSPKLLDQFVVKLRDLYHKDQ